MRYPGTEEGGTSLPRDDNFTENLAKLCQKADQPAQVTDVAVADRSAKLCALMTVPEGKLSAFRSESS